MAGEKRFRTSLFGFNKSDVNLYIERILKEFDDKLRQREEEISLLKTQNKDLRSKYDELMQKADQINEDRAKIAEVLIKAQEKAERMIEEGVNQANVEKKKIEQQVEQEKEKLVDIRSEIKMLKAEVVSTLKKYDHQLGNMMREEAAAAKEETGK